MAALCLVAQHSWRWQRWGCGDSRGGKRTELTNQRRRLWRRLYRLASSSQVSCDDADGTDCANGLGRLGGGAVTVTTAAELATALRLYASTTSSPPMVIPLSPPIGYRTPPTPLPLGWPPPTSGWHTTPPPPTPQRDRTATCGPAPRAPPHRPPSCINKIHTSPESEIHVASWQQVYNTCIIRV